MQLIHLVGTIVYFVVLILLSAYGAHRYVMLYLYYRHRREKHEPVGKFAKLPVVTVQLPLYNEMYVTKRLLASVAALEYPKDKIEIQVLDDSTDETTEIVAVDVAALRQQGFAVEHIHRTNRLGYKAGALENGLQQARGEFIAIFDADFVPQPDLLQRTIHYFTDTKVGMVQTRWGHLNENYSFLTRLQSMFIDGHFVIEQTARSRSGRFFNFNGTAGIWRRTCIEQAGGWEHDTLAEDTDLSYRAQIRGWNFVFLPDIVTPAELPVEMNAFKTQQHRWAKGLIQACKKTLPSLWRADLPWKVKFEGTIHLTSNFGHVMLLILCCLLHPAAASSTQQATGGNSWTRFLLIDLPMFLAASVSVSAFYFCAQAELHEKWWKRLLYVPALMAVGVGLSVNNARAVLEAVFNHQSEFVRTPKFGVCARTDGWRGNKYRALRGLVPYVEIGFGLYFSYLLATALGAGQWSMVPLLMLFQFGFLYVGLMSLMQGRRRSLPPVVPTLTQLVPKPEPQSETNVPASLALQLYSIRREMTADSVGTFRRVPTFGYDSVELAGTYGWSADQWLKLLEETGLKVSGAHLGLSALEGNWGPETLFQQTLGNRWLIVPALPKELQTTDGFRQAAKRLNALGRRAKDEGFSFGYHNHAFEFAALPEGGCGMDILLAETDPLLVAFEVDTYWVEKGGHNARQFIEANAARIGLIHAKELRQSDGADVPAGQGNVDFKAIVPLARQRGWPVVVEFEGEGAAAAVTEGARYLDGL